MPNYCDCELTVTGDQRELERLIAFAKGTMEGEELALAFDKFVPQPKFEGDEWFSWRIEHWGTKWQPVDTKVVLGNNICMFTFNTAWAPPKPIVYAMSRKFPQLLIKLEYYEAGMGFQGRFAIKAGRVIEDSMDEYHGSRGG